MYDVIVIGAGLSGLIVAKYLQNYGKNVLIIEAQERIGGKIYGKYLDNNIGIDLGAQWIGKTHYLLLDLLKKYNFEIYNNETTELHNKLIINDEQYTYFQNLGNEIVDINQFNSNNNSFINSINEINDFQEKLKVNKVQIGNDGFPIHNDVNNELDKISFKEYIQLNTTENFSKQFLSNSHDFCVEAENISLLYVLWALGNSNSPKEQLPDHYLVKNGIWKLPILLSKNLNIQKDEFAFQIEQYKNYAHVYTNKHKYKGKRIIIAMSPILCNKINFIPALPYDKLVVMQNMPMGSVVKIVITYKTQFWIQNGLSGCGNNSASNKGFIHTYYNSSNPNKSTGIITIFITSLKVLKWNKLPREDKQHIILHELSTYLGSESINPETFNYSTQELNQFSQGGYGAVMNFNILTHFIHNFETPYHHIYWTSSDISTKWTGYMEGAILSAKKTATKVVNSFTN